jgi:hypothetical protein
MLMSGSLSLTTLLAQSGLPLTWTPPAS